MAGIISPVSFIVTLFRDDVAMYAVNNNGSCRISDFSWRVFNWVKLKSILK